MNDTHAHEGRFSLTLIGLFLIAIIGIMVLLPSLDRQEGASEGTAETASPHELFSREDRLPFIRLDAEVGRVDLAEKPDSMTVSSSRIEWVNVVVADYPELAPLAREFLNSPTVGTLRPIYIKAYALSDAEIKAQDTSPGRIENETMKLSKTLDRIDRSTNGG